jgi:hypothetical protein
MLSIFLYLAILCLAMAKDLETVYYWKQLMYNFRTELEYDEYLQDKTYTKVFPVHVRTNSIGDLFMSVPRLSKDVPATLSKLLDEDNSATLDPFPSWNDNDYNVANNLQSVWAIEMDSDDRLWAVDQARLDMEKVNMKEVKIKIFDTTTGLVVQQISLQSVVHETSSFITDIVVDAKSNWVYLADAGVVDSSFTRSENPAIIVINHVTGQMRRVLENSTFTNPDTTIWPYIVDTPMMGDKPISMGVSQLALSCDGAVLYFAAGTSDQMYGIRTEHLQNWVVDDPTLEGLVVSLGYKGGVTSDFMTSNDDTLYLSSSENGMVLSYQTLNFSTSFDQSFFYNDFNHENYNWNNYIFKEKLPTGIYPKEYPQSISFDNKGDLLVLSNKFHEFISGEMDFDSPDYGFNFRIYSIDLDKESYMSECNYSNGNSTDSLGVWDILLIVSSSILGSLVLFCVGWNIYRYKRGQSF